MAIKPVNLFPLFNLLPLKMYFFMVRTWSNQACSQRSFHMSYVEKHFKEKRETLHKYKVVVNSSLLLTHNLNPVAKYDSPRLRQEFPDVRSLLASRPFNPSPISVHARSWNNIMPNSQHTGSLLESCPRATGAGFSPLNRRMTW